MDSQHPFVRYLQQGALALDKAGVKTFSRLTPAKRRRLGFTAKKIRSLSDIPKFNTVEQFKLFDEKMDASDKNRRKALSVEYGASLVFDDMERMAEELRHAANVGHSPETINGLVNMYIGLYGRNGINVKYSPYQSSK